MNARDQAAFDELLTLGIRAQNAELVRVSNSRDLWEARSRRQAAQLEAIRAALREGEQARG